MPENLDPEDFITKYGENEFEKMLDNALSMIDFLWMEGLKLIKKEHPETNAIFWSFLRNKVKTIEDYNLKLAYSDEIEKESKVIEIILSFLNLRTYQKEIYLITIK